MTNSIFHLPSLFFTFALDLTQQRINGSQNYRCRQYTIKDCYVFKWKTKANRICLISQVTGILVDSKLFLVFHADKFNKMKIWRR